MYMERQGAARRAAVCAVTSPLRRFDHMLLSERDDAIMPGGRVRLYRLPNGYGLNAINAPGAYRFAYAWEFAVLEPDPADAAGFGDVVFDTPLTRTVKVCLTEEEAAAFLESAESWARGTLG